MDKTGHYRKRSKETPKTRKAKSTKITRLRTEERTRLRTEERNRQEERKRGRHIFRMPFWRPLHPRCLGGVYPHQQAHDTHVHHLDNRHAHRIGPWLTTSTYIVYKIGIHPRLGETHEVGQREGQEEKNNRSLPAFKIFYYLCTKRQPHR